MSSSQGHGHDQGQGHGQGRGQSDTHVTSPGVPSARAPERAPSVDRLVGTVLHDRFRLDEPVARGGMSVLFRATQLPLGRTVAVKLMTAPAAADDALLEKRFLREARAAAQLKHPNTVTVHDYGRTHDGTYFLVMEFLEGRNLAIAIREDGPFEPPRAIPIGLQICGSLEEAHDLGLVHRDLKPLNVFLSPLGGNPDHVCVLDFGLVKSVGNSPDDDPDDPEQDAWETRSGVLMGTPAYMAPEQIVEGTVDARSDIYAFGALLFHMLTGRPPFADKSDFRILQGHVKTPPPELRAVYPACTASPALEIVIRRCLAKNPDRRYPSMADVAAALLECEEESARMTRDSGWLLRPASGSWAIPVRRSTTGQRNAEIAAQVLANAASPQAAQQPTESAPTAVMPDHLHPQSSSQAQTRPVPARTAQTRTAQTSAAQISPAQTATAARSDELDAESDVHAVLADFDLAPASRRWGARLGMLVVGIVLAGLVFGIHRMMTISASGKGSVSADIGAVKPVTNPDSAGSTNLRPSVAASAAPAAPQPGQVGNRTNYDDVGAAAAASQPVPSGNQSAPVAAKSAPEPQPAANPTARRSLTISSSPEGAQVSSRGKKLGVTPFELDAPVDEALPLVIRLNGYKTRRIKATADRERIYVILAREKKRRPKKSRRR